MERWRGRIRKLTKKYRGGEIGRYIYATNIIVEGQREKGTERKKSIETPGWSEQAGEA